MKRVINVYLLFYIQLNGALPSIKVSIKKPANCQTSTLRTSWRRSASYEVNDWVLSDYCCERDNPMNTAGLCVKCAAYSIVTCGSGTTGSEEMLPKNGSPMDMQNPDEGTGQGDHSGY